jgi:hypothetical protein
VVLVELEERCIESILTWSGTGRVLGDWTIEKSCDAVCGMHSARGDKERMILGSASKLRSMVC